MAFLSASINPAMITNTSDVASDAQSKITSLSDAASDAASKATVAMSKASDASSAAAAHAAAISDATSKATVAAAAASDAASKATVATATASDAASKATAALSKASDASSAVVPIKVPSAFKRGVYCPAAADQSGIYVEDNDAIELGTSQCFALRIECMIPDVTPAADFVLAQKHDGTIGWKLELRTTGVLRLTINNGNTYSSTAAISTMGITDGMAVNIVVIVDRGLYYEDPPGVWHIASGYVQFSINGVVLGSSVTVNPSTNIVATLSSNANIYLFGTSAVRYAGIIFEFSLFNHENITPKDLYLLGIPSDQQWGTMTGPVSGCIFCLEGELLHGSHWYDSANTGLYAVLTSGCKVLRQQTNKIQSHDTAKFVAATNAGVQIGLGSDEHGDIFFRNSSGYIGRLAHGTAGQVLATGGHASDPSWVDAATGGGGSTKDITQAGHSFSVGDLLYRKSDSTYAKAKADDITTADVIGIVSAVDGDDFTLLVGGEVTGLSSLTDGSIYFLSATTAGAFTATEPTTLGYVSKPVLIATSTTTAFFFNWRGVLISEGQGSGLVQVQHANIATLVSGNTQIPNDNSIPQNTEGFEVVTCAITPKNVNNLLLIMANVPISSNSMGRHILALFQDTTANALAAIICGGSEGNSALIHKMTAGTVASTTFKIRVGPTTATTIYVNGIMDSTTVVFGGVSATTLTIFEYANP